MIRKASFLFSLLSLGVSSSTFALSLAPVPVDDQLEKADQDAAPKVVSESSFKMQQVSSCSSLESIVQKYMSGSLYQYRNRRYFWGIDGGIIMPMSPSTAMEKSLDTVGNSVRDISASAQSAKDFSQTNTQVFGVDESEEIKTDGTYIYYYNPTERAIFITKAHPASALEVVKKIRIPESFQEVQLYVADKKLTLLASKYVDVGYSRSWVDRSQKTVVAVYDLQDVAHPVLLRYTQLDGRLTNSRRNGDWLYVLSQQSFRSPYFFAQGIRAVDDRVSDKKQEETVPAFSAGDLLPKKLEIRRVSDAASNVVLNGQKIPYQSSLSVEKCSSIQYILPDEETLSKYELSPEFIVVTAINLADSRVDAKSSIILGNAQEIHVSNSNLYIASHLYASQPWACPFFARCIMPIFQNENTLLHKFSLSQGNIAYTTSTVIPGHPLTQYSMDEKDENFRIITHTWTPRGTSLYILDKNLAKKGAITNIAPNEDFKASRFIGNKLYLVTFQQIDPLFVVDVADPKDPKILGELKMPGYSTYLHPYDDTTLIGLGYGTKQNQWGGTQNSGLKIDLYDVADPKNPKQLYSLEMGEQGSYTDAMNNPRLFVWNAARKTLLLPATLYWKKSDTSYENKDAFQGLVAVKIDKTSGISEIAKMTHMDLSQIGTKRKEACQQYLKPKTEPVCRTLIDGSQSCSSTSVNSWVPEYCYADATDGAYFAANMYEWQKDFIKRALFLDNSAYSISDSGIVSWDMNSAFKKIGEVEFSEKQK